MCLTFRANVSVQSTFAMLHPREETLPSALAAYLFSFQLKHLLTRLPGISQGTALGQHALSQRISCYAGVFLVEGGRYPSNKYLRNLGRAPLRFHSLMISFLSTPLGNHNTQPFQPVLARHGATPVALNFNSMRDGSVPQRLRTAEGSRANLLSAALVPHDARQTC